MTVLPTIDYSKHCDIQFKCSSMCPRPHQYNDVRKAFFSQRGLTIEDFHQECAFLLWVLDSEGLLWLYDGSHGGAQYFHCHQSNFTKRYG